MAILIETNKYQTPITQELLDKYPQEVQEQFLDFINNVPYIKNLISPNRPYTRDLPKDENGRAIIDLTNPPLHEDMDYFKPTALNYQKYGKVCNLRPNPNPNSEYGKWIREEVRRIYEGYTREDGEFVTGDMYYFLNYCPILLSKVSSGKKALRVWDFPEFWEGHWLKFIYSEMARNNGHHCAELASRSKGKAHPYSQVVYTPEGKKKWEDIKIGSTLFGDDGKVTKVIDIPFDEETDIYKVTLSDGRTLECSLGHLFKVRDIRRKNYMRIMSLQDIINEDYYHKRKDGRFESYISIPKQGKVEFNSRKILIEPYTLGLLLGDGCFRTNYVNCAMFTSRDDDISTYKKNVPYDIYKIKGKYSYRIKIDNIKKYLEHYNLNRKDSSTKFIPEDYLYNTSEVRMKVLQGLLDTDGTVNNNGIPMITTTSEKLAEDIMFLCRSLGYNVRMFKKQGKYYSKICKETFNISILTNDKVFKLDRKLKLLTDFKSNYSRARKDWTHIIDIKYSHKEKAKCVTVDNDSHCYLIGDFIITHNSFSLASMIAKRFILGESREVNREVKCLVTAYQKEYLTKDGILNKFQSYIDFAAQNTEFPTRRLKSSLNEMAWKMGYIDLDTNTQKGTLNEVLGVSSKDDESKLRGKRSVLIAIEEFGSFPNLLGLFGTLRPSVEEGDVTFGEIYMQGTSGDNDSDFAAAQELMYNPKGYNIQEIPNIYDKEGQGKRYFSYFFPGYLNRKGCYDKDGNSDVVKALLEILMNRYTVKYNSTDLNAITKTISEIPITPQEAIIRVQGNIFPVTMINERLNEIDNNPAFYDDIYVGKLVQNNNGEVIFRNTTDIPIRDFPTKDNKVEGALEIYEMPIKQSDGKVNSERYILSLDNYENDTSNTMSLGSIFVLDLWTDRIVAEYTGRPMFVDDLNEVARLLCFFYNGKLLYENNKKNTFAYFSKMNCLWKLEDTPEYLRQRQMVKNVGYGNTAKGVSAIPAVKNHGFTLIRDWLLKPVTILSPTGPNNEEIEIQVPNLHFIKNRALLKELSLFNPDINVDRIMSLVQLMIFREQKMITYQGNIKRDTSKIEKDYAGNDEFFTRNFDARHI